MGVELTDTPAQPVALVAGLEQPGDGPHHDPLPGIAVEMLTSGTTGPPKRVRLGYAALQRSLLGAAHYEQGKHRAEKATLRQGVVIISAPPGANSEEHCRRKWLGLSKCSMTSRAVINSNLAPLASRLKSVFKSPSKNLAPPRNWPRFKSRPVTSRNP